MPELSKLNQELFDLFLKGDSFNAVILKRYENELIEAYQIALKNVEGMLADIYKNFGDKVDLTTLQAYNRLNNLHAEIAAELKKLNSTSTKTVQSAGVDQYKQNYYYTGYVTETTIQARLGFAGLKRETILANLANAYSKIGWQSSGAISETVNILNRQLKTLLNEALIQGYGFAKTARMAEDTFGASVSNNMLRIVRTESLRAQTVGNLAGFAQSEKGADKLGIVTSRIWISALLPKRTRISHGLADGQRAKKREGHEGLTFEFRDGVITAGPGLSGVARHDINCLCSTRMEVHGLTPTQRRWAEDKQLYPPDIPYRKWAEIKGIPL